MEHIREIYLYTDHPSYAYDMSCVSWFIHLRGHKTKDNYKMVLDRLEVDDMIFNLLMIYVGTQDGLNAVDGKFIATCQSGSRDSTWMFRNFQDI
jgi:hypothetical protein